MRGKEARHALVFARRRFARARGAAALLCAGLLLALWSSSVSAGDTPAAPPPPRKGPARIAFEQKAFDAGKVLTGQTVTHVYRFRNSGGEPLRIRRVRPSCGCTAALLSKRTLVPGEAGEVEVRFDTRDRHGFQEIHVEVVSNDERERDGARFTSMLRLRAQVTSLLQVLPLTAYFPAFRRGAPQSVRVTILPKAKGAPLRVTKVETSSPFILATPRPYALGGRQGAELTIALSDRMPLGRIDGRVTVTTDHPRQKTVRIPVIGAVHGDLVAFPERMMLAPRLSDPDEAHGLIVLKRVGGKGPLEVLRHEAPAWVELTPETVIPGQQIEVTVALRPHAPPGARAGEIRLFTGDPQTPLFRIPVTCVVPPRVLVEPSALVFTPSRRGPVTLRVFLPPGRHLLGASFDPVSPTAPPQGPCIVAVDPSAAAVTVTPREELWTGATPRGLRAAPGEPDRYQQTLRLGTDVPGEEEVAVPVLLLPAQAEKR